MTARRSRVATWIKQRTGSECLFRDELGVERKASGGTEVIDKLAESRRSRDQGFAVASAIDCRPTSAWKIVANHPLATNYLGFAPRMQGPAFSHHSR